jgi:ABC-type lipoprotein export system ATPase subunit
MRIFKRSKPISEDINHENGSNVIIDLRKVVKTYSSAAGNFEVLKDIDAQILAGEFVAIIGKSGSGKSTLVNMITGIDRPTSGEIYVNQTAVHTLNEGQMAVWRGRNLGIVFQFFQLLPMLSLVENIMLPMDFCNMYSPRQRKERAMELLQMVEMEDHAKKLPSAISGGQQQRVAIARALANDPPMILADEPTGNLDSKTSDVIFKMFDQLVEEGKTLVMVTHDSSQAQRVSRTILLADGEIVNQYVAQALPALTHEQMLEATRRIEPMHFEPGAIILKEGEKSDKFYIVTRGQAEVSITRPGASDVVVSKIGAGEYFGEVELMRGGANKATVHAGLMPVEVIAIDQQTIQHILDESEAMKQALEEVADEHLAENIETRKSDRATT